MGKWVYDTDNRLSSCETSMGCLLFVAGCRTKAVKWYGVIKSLYNLLIYQALTWALVKQHQLWEIHTVYQRKLRQPSVINNSRARGWQTDILKDCQNGRLKWFNGAEEGKRKRKRMYNDVKRLTKWRHNKITRDSKTMCGALGKTISYGW